jgi:hypothetical protein
MLHGGHRPFARELSMKTATDDELVEIASESEGGGGAIVESQRRLRSAIERQAESADRYSRRLLVLTWVLVALTAVLVAREVVSLVTSA